MSKKYIVENGTPQGSVISSLLFFIMINYIFDNIPLGMGKSLFADDGALWEKGRSVNNIFRKMQEGINFLH